MYRYFFISILLLAHTGFTTKAQQTLRVLTYNIHHANPPSEKKEVIKLEAIAEVIQNSKADVAAIQELDSCAARSGNFFQLQQLAHMLGMHYYFGSAIPYDGGAYGVGILSKYPIIAATTTVLPKMETPQSESRVLALAKLQLPHNKTVWFGATHLDVHFETNRLMQVKKIIEITNDKSPVIIGGDFNAETKDASIQKMKTAFINASVQQAPTIPNIRPTKKIDYIFYDNKQKIKLLDEKVITEAVYASDHLPFWVDITF